MGGIDEIVEIDESMFGGSGKYKKGRYLTGDRRSRKRRFEEGVLADSPRNYGAQVSGNWVFGMWWNKEKEIRMFKVNRRDRATLEPLIRRCG